ncbi:hypothetical protein ACP275_07G104100 [Erythranthe tilingii]
MVRDTLLSERCLIVLDGVESMSEESWLHMVKRWFDFLDMGSVVLITTSHKQVADLVAAANQQFELPGYAAAWSWYRHHSYDWSGNDKLTPHMAKNVVALCRGNPLSVKLVRSLMRDNDSLSTLFASLDFSEGSSLLPPPAARYDDAVLSAVILLCVWALPPHVRHCFAYCSVFPKGYALNKQKVVRMLTAHFDEDYFKDDTPDSCVGYLISRSLFMDVTEDDSRNIIEFRMPDLIHKIAEDVATFVFQMKLGVIGSIVEDAAKLSFEWNYNSQQQHLRTMILSSTIYRGSVNLDHSLDEFTGLRSLDLSCSGVRTLTEDIRALKELRYLNLSYTFIEKLPNSVVKLSKLQTLDLSWCFHLKHLPEGMRKLTNMMHLDLYRCESLSELPSGISSLKYLTSMPLFVLGNSEDRDCARLKDLGSLKRLRGRLEIRNLENVRKIDEARYAMMHHKHLDHLSLSWSRQNASCFEILVGLVPNTCFQVLDLKGYTGFKFPDWLSSMINLMKISISNAGCKKLPSLGQLPYLKELQLKGIRWVESIGPELYGGFDHRYNDLFPSLEKLGLHDLPSLSEWSTVSVTHPKYSSRDGVFPRLETLTVEGCPKLESMPYIRNLCNLTLCESSSEILNSLTINSGGDERPSSVLIKDMKLGTTSLKKFFSRLKFVDVLILFNIDDESIDRYLDERGVDTRLKHLGIQNCHQLRCISWSSNKYLQKVHISDCQKLETISVPASSTNYSVLEELVVEDCPQATTINEIGNLGNLRKLIIKNCSTEFDIHCDDLSNHLKKLEYLLISGCPKLEMQLREKPSLISRIPCVAIGNRKTVLAPTQMDR